MQSQHPWSRRALAGLALACLTVAPAALNAQATSGRRPLLRVAPSMAWALAADVGSSEVTAGSIRGEIPVTAHLAPWFSWSGFQLGLMCIPEAPSCPSDGSVWLAGLMVDPQGQPCVAAAVPGPGRGTVAQRGRARLRPQRDFRCGA